MGLDIRLPIGAFFLLIGLVLAAYGILDGSSKEQTLGININLIWGVVLLVFGGLMAWAGSRRVPEK
jgi:hypothetical protein